MQQVEIRIKGHIDRDWSDWVDSLTVAHTPWGETVISGAVVDQAVLYGLISRFSNLGLELISVTAGPLRK